RMTTERGKELSYVLQGPAPSASTLLSGAAIESLAGLGSASSCSPEDRLLLACFRWREGDPGSADAARAAQAALGAGRVPPEDPMVAELEQRIESSLAAAVNPQGERREKAVEKLRLLRTEPGNRDKKLKRIDVVLQYADALNADELSEVRGLRDALDL